MRRPARQMLPAIALALAATLALADSPRSPRLADQEALKPYADLVGSWRGTGQPQRSSIKGAWRETATWAWKLSPDSAALELTVEDGKYLRSALLRPGQAPGRYILEATQADGATRLFDGETGQGGKLVLDARTPSTAEVPGRITITPLHGTRVLLLLEGQVAGSGRYFRLAEVGYTREGVAFAAGDSYPACIVTGGRGTTEVTYQGKTYWVCCSGCKDLFEDDPAAILAEAAGRRQAEGGK